MSQINFNIVRTTGKASLSPRSYIFVWQTSETIEEVYRKVEQAWSDHGYKSDYGRSFYKSKASAMKQLRGRYTMYTKKDVPLREMSDQKWTGPAPTKIDWSEMANLAKSLYPSTRGSAEGFRPSASVTDMWRSHLKKDN